MHNLIQIRLYRADGFQFRIERTDGDMVAASSLQLNRHLVDTLFVDGLCWRQVRIRPHVYYLGHFHLFGVSLQDLFHGLRLLCIHYRFTNITGGFRYVLVCFKRVRAGKELEIGSADSGPYHNDIRMASACKLMIMNLEMNLDGISDTTVGDDRVFVGRQRTTIDFSPIFAKRDTFVTSTI